MHNIVILFMLLYDIHCTFAVTHSLQYVFTGTSGTINFPEFVSVGMVDEESIDYYDSNIGKAQPRQEWMAKYEGADYWETQNQILKNHEKWFKQNIEILKNRFNQTGGIHTFQMMHGCEWDEDTETTDAHELYGYDGDDFIKLDLKTMNWVAPVRQAVITKQKIDNDRRLIESEKNYFSNICIEWLKKYVRYGKDTLNRKVRPEVSLLQKDSFSPVSCHATGFFPKGVMVNWQKDGREMHEDVETTELLPNGDGSFQIRSILRVSPEDLKNHQFSCVVNHVSLEEKIVKMWVPGSNLLPIVIGCVVVALLAICAVAAFFAWKKKNQGYGKTSTSDTDSENSGQQAPKA